MITTVPGTCVLRKTISDECRKGRSDFEVRNTVLMYVEQELKALLARTPMDLGFKVHVVIVAERPEPGMVEGEGASEPKGIIETLPN